MWDSRLFFSRNQAFASVKNNQNTDLLFISRHTALNAPDDLLAKAKVKASKDRRSLSKYLILLIEADVKDEPTPRTAAPDKKKR
jgi:hypothetical protein